MSHTPSRGVQRTVSITRRALAIAVLAAAALSGCTLAMQQEIANVHIAATPTQSGLSATDLVGTWDVTGPEVEPATVIQIGAGEFALHVDCGILNGYITARAGLFLATRDGVWAGCAADPATPWITDAATVRANGQSFELVDVAGELMATLSPSTAELDTSGVPSSLTDAASPEAAVERSDPEVVSLPGDAAYAKDIYGEWIPAGAVETTLTISPEGYWTTNYCGGSGGRFRYGAAGEWLSAIGPVNYSTCTSADNGFELYFATSAGIVGQTLTFFDETGEVIGEATRA